MEISCIGCGKSFIGNDVDTYVFPESGTGAEVGLCKICLPVHAVRCQGEHGFGESTIARGADELGQRDFRTMDGRPYCNQHGAIRGWCENCGLTPQEDIPRYREFQCGEEESYQYCDDCWYGMLDEHVTNCEACYSEEFGSEDYGEPPYLSFHKGVRFTPVSWAQEFPVGFEVEAERGEYERISPTLLEESGWGSGSDGSLDETGIELRSPPLNGPMQLASLEKILPHARAAGFSPTRNAGIHGHVWAEEVDTNALYNILNYFHAYEGVMYAMMPMSRRDNHYCRSNSEYLLECVRPGFSSGMSRSEWNREIGSTAHGNALNIQPYLRPESLGKDVRTLEFRAHGASLSPEKVNNWGKIIRGIVMYGCEGYLDMPSPDTCLTTSGNILKFLKGINQESLFDYVAGRILLFEKNHPHSTIRIEDLKAEGASGRSLITRAERNREEGE